MTTEPCGTKDGEHRDEERGEQPDAAAGEARPQQRDEHDVRRCQREHDQSSGDDERKGLDDLDVRRRNGGVSALAQLVCRRARRPAPTQRPSLDQPPGTVIRAQHLHDRVKVKPYAMQQVPATGPRGAARARRAGALRGPRPYP
jgi:hypothetical protein